MRYQTQITSPIDFVSATKSDFLGNKLNEVKEVTESMVKKTSSHKSIKSTQYSYLTLIKQSIILLVEDDPIIQKVHRVMLERMGYRVDIAANGSQALALAKTQYDLILMDIGLPDIDGLTVTAAIRQQFAAHKITPIIALTAYGHAVTEESLAAGIDEVAVKPIKLEELASLIKKWLSKK